MKRLTSLFPRVLTMVLCTLVFTASSWSQKEKKLSDAEIASVAVVANQTDVDAAKLAQQNSKDAHIRVFASTMISDDTSVIEKASALKLRSVLNAQQHARPFILTL